jgi:hypothetical protein
MMGSGLRSLAAVVACLALVAMLPVPCPCPDEKAAPRTGHECCAPPAGVRSSDHGCCDEHAEAADLLVPAPNLAPAPGDVASARPQPVALLAVAPRGSIVLAPSPPPAILRL